MIRTKEIRIRFCHLKDAIEKDYWGMLFTLNKISLYGIYYYYPIWSERNKDLIVQFEDIRLNELFIHLIQHNLALDMSIEYLGIGRYLNEVSDLIVCLSDYTKTFFNPKMMYSIRSTITDKYWLLLEIKGIGNDWVYEKNILV